MSYAKKLSPSLLRALKETPVPWGPLGYVVYKRCVDIETPVLCADLLWRKAGDLQEGQEIIAFDDDNDICSKQNWRYLRVGKVTHNTIEDAETMGIELEDGTILYATPDHAWLVKMSNSVLEWRETKDLEETRKGGPVYLLRPFGKVWEQDKSYEGGYISAAYDGEGNLDRLNGMVFVQVQNSMLSQMESFLTVKEIPFKKHKKKTPDHRQQVYTLRFHGLKNLFSFLGKFQPRRLIDNVISYLKTKNEDLPTLRCSPDDYVRVVRVFPAGIRKIAVLSTDVGTHFTGGFASHNTYARPLYSEGRTEEWYETVARCTNALLEYGMALEEQELPTFVEHFHQLRMLPAGRGLWQLGAETVTRNGAASLMNCLAGETKVLTRQGWKEIRSLVDQDVELVTRGGKWVTAPVRSFGSQQLYKIVCSTGGRSGQIVYHATENHRWFAKRKKDAYAEFTTANLKEGDILQVVRPRNLVETLSPQGIVHGIVFGDGHKTSVDASVILCNKKKSLAKYFSQNHKSYETEDRICFTGLPWSHKALPGISENKTYLMGFLAGLIATDGSVSTSGQITIANASKETLQKIKDIAAVLGFRTGNIFLVSDTNPYTSEPRELWQLGFKKQDAPERLLVREDQKERFQTIQPSENKREGNIRVVSVEPTNRFEEVYCATVAGEYAFVIEGMVLTGNCYFVPIDSIESFCFLFDMLMVGGGVGFSIATDRVYKLPDIRPGVQVTRRDTSDVDYVVPDNREGWVELLRRVLTSFFVTGRSFTYSCHCIRSKGAPIRGFGGTASGPEELAKGLTNICTILGRRAGKSLRPIDALDICNIIASVVVAGNVRRSAQIALGYSDDTAYLNAKRWDLGNIPNWRAMSNNTLMADSYEEIPSLFWDGYQGNGEPYGLFNLDLARSIGRIIDGKRYPDPRVRGINPCQPGFATVITPEGLTTFSKIGIGSKIWTETGWATVTNKWSTGTKPVYKYSTTAGFFLGTEDHRLVSDGQKIKAKECASVDLLAGPYAETTTHDYQAVMDGLVIGDGTVHKASNNKVLLCIGSKDSDYHTSEISHLIISHRPGIDSRMWDIKTTITAEELPRTFLRTIPSRYYYSDAGTTKAFLRGLFSANGSVLKCGRVSLKASSRALIEQVQLMLSSVGICSYITTTKATTVAFSNGNYVCRESYALNINKDADKFFSAIGFLQGYKQKILEAALSANKNNSSDRKKTNYDITSIQYMGDFEVFDITVDNAPHTYWTGGLNVSNCAEQTLDPWECCCLVELCLPLLKDLEQFHSASENVYRIAKTMISLKHHWPQTNTVMEENRRIGIGITGICQQTKFASKAYGTVYNHLRDFDLAYSRLVGVRPSIKITTTKPSGTVSLLPGVTPGIHPAYAQHYIRRIRMSATDPLVAVAITHGYPVESVYNFDGTADSNTVVVSFPIASPRGTRLARDMSAIDQLELQKQIQTYWSDNAVSITCYYKKEELPAIHQYLKDNYKTTIKSVSFLLHSDHGFKQAPYEEITKEQYTALSSQTRPITSLTTESSSSLDHTLSDNQECTSGACPIR